MGAKLLKRFFRTAATGEKVELAFRGCMPERSRQTRSRFGAWRKREGGIGVAERMIANVRVKPMRVRPRRSSPASDLPVHVGSATVNAALTIT
jgi:hypothetical protein